LNTLLAAVHPLPEGDGELLNGDGPDDPLPDVVDGILGEGKVSQLLLHTLEQGVVCRHQIRRIGRVLEHLGGVGGKRILHNGGSVNSILSNHLADFLERPRLS
jgi:hypothetical protein